jgi:hypothetical protein
MARSEGEMYQIFKLLTPLGQNWPLDENTEIGFGLYILWVGLSIRRAISVKVLT